MPELPWERRARYAGLGLKESDAVYLGATLERNKFFDAVLAELNGSATLATLSANYIVSDLGGYYAKSDGIEFEFVSPKEFATLMRMVEGNELSSRGAKDVLAVMAEKGGSPKEIASERGLLQVSDPEALRGTIREVIEANASVVEEYKAGKEILLKFLVGQAMKATKGSGNPSMLQDLLVEEIKK